MGPGSRRGGPLHPWHHGGHQRGPRTPGRADRYPHHRGLSRRPRTGPPDAPSDVRPQAGPRDTGVPRPRRPADRGPRAGVGRRRSAGAPGRRLAGPGGRQTDRPGGRGDCRLLPVFLPSSRTRATGPGIHPTPPPRGDGVAVFRGRSHLPRVRTHLRHRLRRLQQTGGRPLPGRHGTRPGCRRGAGAGADHAVPGRPGRGQGGTPAARPPVPLRPRCRRHRRPGGGTGGGTERSDHARRRRNQQ